MRSASRRSGGGFLLFEIMIAIAIFAIVAVGLATAMQATIDASLYLDRQTAIRYGLESMLNEARQRSKRDEMQLNHRDEQLAIDYKTELEEIRYANMDGESVNGLYELRAIAEFSEDGERQTETAEVYVYRP